MRRAARGSLLPSLRAAKSKSDRNVATRFRTVKGGPRAPALNAGVRGVACLERSFSGGLLPCIRNASLSPLSSRGSASRRSLPPTRRGPRTACSSTAEPGVACGVRSYPTRGIGTRDARAVRSGGTTHARGDRRRNGRAGGASRRARCDSGRTLFSAACAGSGDPDRADCGRALTPTQLAAGSEPSCRKRARRAGSRSTNHESFPRSSAARANCGRASVARSSASRHSAISSFT